MTDNSESIFAQYAKLLYLTLVIAAFLGGIKFAYDYHRGTQVYDKNKLKSLLENTAFQSCLGMTKTYLQSDLVVMQDIPFTKLDVENCNEKIRESVTK